MRSLHEYVKIRNAGKSVAQCVSGCRAGIIFLLCLHCVSGWNRAGTQVFGGAHHLFVASSTCRPRPRAGVLSVKADANDQANDNASKITAMEEKLARWRAQAEELRLKDKDSAVSRARASQTLLPDLDKVSNEADEGRGDELIGGPRGTARRTVVDRMRDLKISERRAELSADVQKFREQEEMSAAERGERAKALDAERQRLKKEIEEDAAKWAEKKNAYWKAGLDSRFDVPEALQKSENVDPRLVREFALDRAGIQMRPLEVITTQLRQWRESSAEKKAKQLAKASVDIGFTVLNMVAIAIGILLKRPVEVPNTSLDGRGVRGALERAITDPMGSIMSIFEVAPPPPPLPRDDAPPPPPAATWADLIPAVTKVTEAANAAVISDVATDYQRTEDEEADYLAQKLRENWKRKTHAKSKSSRPKAAPLAPAQAYSTLSSLISQGDYGGVKALLRDTCEAPEIYQVLLGYTVMDSSQAPAIILAAAEGQQDICAALMDAGSNPRAVDSLGRTASQVAEAAGHTELAKTLITWAATRATD